MLQGGKMSHTMHLLWYQPVQILRQIGLDLVDRAEKLEGVSVVARAWAERGATGDLGGERCNKRPQ